jgi:hypothetical protein
MECDIGTLFENGSTTDDGDVLIALEEIPLYGLTFMTSNLLTTPMIVQNPQLTLGALTLCHVYGDDGIGNDLDHRIDQLRQKQSLDDISLSACVSYQLKNQHNAIEKRKK